MNILNNSLINDAQFRCTRIVGIARTTRRNLIKYTKRTIGVFVWKPFELCESGHTHCFETKNTFKSIYSDNLRRRRSYYEIAETSTYGPARIPFIVDTKENASQKIPCTRLREYFFFSPILF